MLQGALSEIGRMVPEVWVVSELQEKGSGLSLKIRVEKENSVLPVSELHGLYDLHLALQKLIKRRKLNDKIFKLKEQDEEPEVYKDWW